MNKVFTFYFCCLISLFSACGDNNKNASEGKLQVAASTSIVADWVANIAGERAQVHTIAEAGSDPHSYQVTAKKMASYSNSALLVMVDENFDKFAEDGISKETHKLKLTKQLKGLQQGGCQACGHHHGEHKHSADGDNDPHIWYSIDLVSKSCDLIAAELIRLDPEGKAIYEQNLKSYKKQLQDIYNQAKTLVATVPKDKRRLVLMHRNLGYFSSEFGFTIEGTVLNSLSSETADPSPGALAKLVDKVKAQKIQVVFPEQGGNYGLLETIAAECKIRVAKPLWGCTLSKKGEDADTYLKYILANTRIICEELSR